MTERQDRFWWWLWNVALPLLLGLLLGAVIVGLGMYPR